jgi:uncharacterized membrane protein required for colicin V production
MNNHPEILRQFNWVDIFVAILALRILYISFKNGLKFEFFKILGIFCAMFLALQYYTSVSAFLNARVFNRPVPSSFLNSVAFFLLAVAGYGFFFIVRIILSKFIHTEIDARVDKWGGLTVGVFRAALTASIVLLFFLATAKPYFRKSIQSSFSGTHVARVAHDTYVFFWDNFAAKVQKNDKINPAVSDLTIKSK